MPATRTTLLLATTVALLIVGTAMATPESNRLRQQQQLLRLLNEGGTSVLSIGQCDALPVDYLPTTNDTPNCGAISKFTSWPTAESFCQVGYSFDGTKADAESKCIDRYAGGKLLAPANDAERCAITHFTYAPDLALSTTWLLSGITDEATEGVWLGPDGEAIDPAYLNWASGQPDNGAGGTAENCVAYFNNEAYDVICANVVPDGVSARMALCTARPPPAV